MAEVSFDPTGAGLESKTAFPLDRSKLKDVKTWNPDLQPAVLLSCGSFSPPTVMHTRIFETARNHFCANEHACGIEIVGAFLSPVHDGYGKKGLGSAQDRVDMCKEATLSSDWIMVDDWETKQAAWTRTRVVFERFHQALNENKELNGGREIRVLLLCGSDLLETMTKPDIWIPSDISMLLGPKHGMACINRPGAIPEKIVEDSDDLYDMRRNIFIIRELSCTNDVSSTAIRRALKRKQSVKYLVLDGVERIIRQRNLYQ